MASFGINGAKTLLSTTRFSRFDGLKLRLFDGIIPTEKVIQHKISWRRWS